MVCLGVVRGLSFAATLVCVWALAAGCDASSGRIAAADDGGPAADAMQDVAQDSPDASLDASSLDASSEAGPPCSSSACSQNDPQCSGVQSDCPPWSCGLQTLCGDANFSQTGGSSTGGPVMYTAGDADTEANARCALTALRDGTIGQIGWSTPNENVGGENSYVTNIVAGRLAYGSWVVPSDSPPFRGRSVDVKLRDANYFQTCLDSASIDQYARCLLDSTAGC